MASAWIVTRTTSKGKRRFRVLFRPGGRESAPRYAGSFKTKSEAVARKQWVSGELAARRMPNLASLETDAGARTLAAACERWRESRVDVAEGTRVLHRVALARVTPLLGQRRVDTLTVDDVNELVASLSAADKKRETIRKSIKYLAAVLEEEGVDPNPARSKRIRLPHEEHVELEPPTSEHVVAVSDCYRPRIACRSCGSTGAGPASHPWRRCALATTTSHAVACACARLPPRREQPCGWSSRTFLRRRSRPDCRRARIAIRRRRSFRVSVPTGCGRRSHAPARPPGSPLGRHTTCATAGSASSTGRAGAGPRSRASSDSGSSRSRATSTPTS
jgi:hypothetical protein